MLRLDLRLDEVVAVHGRRHRDLGQAGGHELQQRHLRGRVLHRDTVGIEVGVAATALELLAVRVAQVVDEDLLRRASAAGRAARRPSATRSGRRSYTCSTRVNGVEAVTAMAGSLLFRLRLDLV